VLAELGAPLGLAVLLAQQHGVPAHHRRHLPQGRQRLDLPAGEGRGQVAEQPRPAQAAAADHHPGAAGLLHHAHRVGRLPDVTVAQHRDGHGRGQLADGRPVGGAGVVLLRGASVQGDGRTAGVRGGPPRVEVGEVVGVHAQAGLHGDRDAVRCSRPDRRVEDLGEQPALPRQRGAAPLARHLGHRAAEVEVDVVDAVVAAQDLDRLADVDRVDAVQLHGPDLLGRVEVQHGQAGAVPLDDAARRHHLADVQARALLAAQPPEGGVRHARHRRQHDRRGDLEVAQTEHGRHGHPSIVPGRSAQTPIRVAHSGHGARGRPALAC
jgi:hypothetical protein